MIQYIAYILNYCYSSYIELVEHRNSPNHGNTLNIYIFLQDYKTIGRFTGFVYKKYVVNIYHLGIVSQVIYINFNFN